MTVQRVTFEGAAAVELTAPGLRLVAVYDKGPRIAFWGRPNGDNLLLWPTSAGRGDWRMMGGHRIWITLPGGDHTEDTYEPDNDPCEVELFDDGFKLTGKKSPIHCTRRGFEVRLQDDDRVTVDNFLINSGDMLFSGGIWALTVTPPKSGNNRRYGVPLGDGSKWNTATVVLHHTWGGHDPVKGGFNDPQFSYTSDMLLINPSGNENKRMIRADHGIIAMRDQKLGVTFAKRVVYQPAATYPLSTNVSVYVNEDMVEMETLGPQETLKPDAELHHIETWVLAPSSVGLEEQKLVQLFTG